MASKVSALVIGSDHAGVGLKDQLVTWLRSPAGGQHEVVDVGTRGLDSVDYPDFAEAVARRVSRDGSKRGILLCGTGIGMSIAANKVPGARAAVAWDAETAGLAAEHNKANILCLPARFADLKRAQKMIQTFLSTPFGEGRHGRRVRKIGKLDRRA